MRKTACVIGLMAFGWGAATAFAAGVSSDLQRQVRGATFEVVMKKPEKDPLSYEKPLPLELLPFHERTDLYQSIGTAFALGDNTYVTAGHVLMACISSQNGPPALRGPDGKIHPLDRVLKFSQHEDFAVFSVADDPAPVPLATNREPQLDDPVLAVGNALGEGIVIRDGLYTSATPEDQDGLWKWIRFSAAASPGNSGGPLLDAGGRVVGIVIGKSQNENLNYALPISRVLDAPAGQASFNVRTLESLPFLRTTRTFSYQQQFAIAHGWNEFVAAYRHVIDARGDESRSQLLDAASAEMFPKGQGVEALLYDVIEAYDPGVVEQGTDGAWGGRWARYERTDLPDDGYVSVGLAGSIPVLRMHRSANASDAAFYDDTRAVMDLALKGMNLRRQVGSDAVRVTSAGAAQSNVLFEDHYGRRWQERIWALPYMDAYVVMLMLPTPDGYAAIVQYAPSLLLREVQKRLELSADLFYVSYRGTLPQWQSFLARHDLVPDALREVKLVKLAANAGWQFKSKRVELSIAPDLLKLDDHSVLGLQMAYLQDGKRTVWDVGGIDWYQDEHEKNYLALRREPRAPDSAHRELRDRWQDMYGRRSPYTGSASRDSAAGWTVESVLDAPGDKPGFAADDLLYGLKVHVEDLANSGEVDKRQRAAVRAVRILESGTGAHALYAATPAAGVEPDVDRSNFTLDSAGLDHQGDAFEASVMAALDFVGPDIRGRRPADDYRDVVLTPAFRAQYASLRDRAAASTLMTNNRQDIDTLNAQLDAMKSQYQAVSESLFRYWMEAKFLDHEAKLRRRFLEVSNLPADHPHSPEVVALRAQLIANWQALLAQGELAHTASQLVAADIGERMTLGSASFKDKGAADNPELKFEPRPGACPAPAGVTPHGTQEARFTYSRSADDFYPPESRTLGEEGRVILAVRMDERGCPTAVAIGSSSGSDALDAAARRYVFETVVASPATVNDRAVPTTKALSVKFAMRQ